MKKLTESEILQLMREEWNSKLMALSENVDAIFKAKVDGEDKQVLDKDLKLRHKKTQFLYTVVSVGPRDAVLKTPEGTDFLVDKETLEDEYELD